jgi:two-component system, cell cycle sensor histidine kinase and response regulator CckA
MHRAKRPILKIGCIVAVIGIWVAIFLQVDHDRHQAQRTAESNSANLAKAFEEHVLSVVQQIDTHLILLRDEYQSNPQFFHYLQGFYKKHNLGRLIIQISVIDAQGNMVFNNKGLSSGSVFLGDRDHFLVHRDRRDDFLFISKPVLGRVSKQWCIQFTRSIRHRDGTFAGVMVFSIDPEVFANFFRSVDVGKDGAITLAGTDRVIRARSSAQNMISNFEGIILPADSPLFDPKKPDSGIFHSSSATDGVLRFWSYRRLQGYPLVVTVGLSENDTFRPVNARRNTLILWGVLVSTLMLLSTRTILWFELRQQRIEQKLRDANQRLELATASGHLGIWDWDISTGALTWDGRMFEMFGIEPGSFTGTAESFQKAIHPDDLEKTSEAIKSAIKGERDYDVDYRVVHLDGTVKNINSSGLVIRDSAGNAVRMIGLNRDITEGKQAEMSLRTSEEKFSTAFRASPDAININRLHDGMYLEINEGFTTITGYSSEDVIGRTSLELNIWVNPDDRARLVSGLNQYGVVNNLEAQFRRKDGATLTGFMSARIIEIDGEPCVLSVSRDISDRKRMEDLLRESESREKERAWELSTIMESVPTPILIAHDRDGRRITGNRAACELFHIPTEANLSKRAVNGTGPNHFAILHDDVEIPLGQLPLQRALHGERIKGYQMDVLFDDGTQNTLYGNAAPLRDEQGCVRGAVAAFLDITTYTRTARELRDSEERYRTLFDESPFGVVLVDPETFEVLHFNPAACKNLGYEPDEFSRLHVIDFAVMEDQEEIKMRSEKVLHHGGVSFETIHRTKQGELRNVMVNLKTITVAGKPMIQSIIRDITESKRSQQLLELYLYALDNAKDQIFMSDRTSRFIYVNQAACTTLGYSRDELLGMGVSDIDPNFPTEAWEDHWQDLKSQSGLRLETSHRSKDGKMYPIEMSLKSFVFDKVEYILAVARDLTEQKQLEAEKLEMERRLLHSQKLESLGVLAGGIAHDFNNILTSIVGNADLALMRINKGLPGVDNLHRIEEAAARAADLAKQMLAYSGKGQFVVEHINLNRLLEGMMQLLEVSISKKVELRFNPMPNLPSVKVDTTQIHQIVMNLVINASEAIGDNIGVIAVTTGYMDCDQRYLKDIWREDNLDEGLYVYFEIADTGCGMDHETITKIFDPFFTTKFTGRGLGMAAVLGIVRGHKGAIKIHSEPNKGSSFKILLPASGNPAELINNVSEQGDWRGSGTVLLVDDEESVRGIGKEMLHELGFTTITASDGQEALEIIKTTPHIAFVLLDLSMPQMDGEQCFHGLRQMNPDIKVIMSSGFSEHEVTQKFAGKGMAGFIQKPYKLSVLKDAINSLKLSAPN